MSNRGVNGSADVDHSGIEIYAHRVKKKKSSLLRLLLSVPCNHIIPHREKNVRAQSQP